MLLGIGISVSACSGSSPAPISQLTGSVTGLLPTAAAPPPHVAVTTFSPGRLGVTLQIPTAWVPSAPAYGFQYIMLDPDPAHAFLGIGSYPSATGASPSEVGESRSRFLSRLGGTVTSVTTGTIQAHPGVRLSYRLPNPGHDAVVDTEYDVLLGRPANTDLIIVLGEAAPPSNPGILSWVATTIRIGP